MSASRSGPARRDALAHLSLLGRFALHLTPETSIRHELPVSSAGQKVLALLALQARPVSRDWMTGQLWPDSDQRHGSWCLRAALHRLPLPQGHRLVVGTDDRLALAPEVEVDVHVQGAHALAVAEGGPSGDGHAVQLDHISALEHDVLPGWDEDWLLLERERHRQLRLHALESLARSLTAQRRYALALHCALAAVDAEPLRESAHRRVIEVHLAEGNVGEAIRQFRLCSRHFARELRISPSRSLHELVFGSSA
jgi:DNA-binding SARP family transcriptional activator